jgi:hypothetical protein
MPSEALVEEDRDRRVSGIADEGYGERIEHDNGQVVRTRHAEIAERQQNDRGDADDEKRLLPPDLIADPADEHGGDESRHTRRHQYRRRNRIGDLVDDLQKRRPSGLLRQKSWQRGFRIDLQRD